MAIYNKKMKFYGFIDEVSDFRRHIHIFYREKYEDKVSLCRLCDEVYVHYEIHPYEYMLRRLVFPFNESYNSLLVEIHKSVTEIVRSIIPEMVKLTSIRTNLNNLLNSRKYITQSLFKKPLLEQLRDLVCDLNNIKTDTRTPIVLFTEDIVKNEF